jgi:hypothetical protein
MYVILFITHHRYHSLTHLKTTAIEIQGIKIIKKKETRRKEHFLGVTICSTALSAMCYLFSVRHLLFTL